MKNVVVLSFFALFFLFDIHHDLVDGIPFSHVWHELALFGLAIAALTWQLRTILKKDNFIELLNSELLETQRSYQEWKDRTHTNALAIRSLIDQQFGEWELSPGEKDVALLLVKGLAMKEIAEIRSTSEKTVKSRAFQVGRNWQLSSLRIS